MPGRHPDLAASAEDLAVYVLGPDGALYESVGEGAQQEPPRDRHPMMLLLSCITLLGPDGQAAGPYYFFSITAAALEQQPWREGTVCLLPADGFEAQPPVTIGQTAVHVAQAANSVPVTPMAKLTVRPADFPFLQQIRGHDDNKVNARATADPEGFLWLDA